MSSGAESLLRTALSAAVPLWAMQIAREHWTYDRLREEASQCADVIASKGDVLLFKSPKKGETAASFNALARALAIMSFVPGGVTFLGDTWKFQPATYPLKNQEDGSRD